MMNAALNSGRCQPTTPAAVSVVGGKPTHGAVMTPDQSTRKCVSTASVAALYEVICPKTLSKTQDST